MIRIVFVLVAVFLLIVFIRRLVAPASKSGAVAPGEELVRCRYCGMYVTKESAVTAGEHYFCSSEHKDSLEG